jgi:hypothetical protein
MAREGKFPGFENTGAVKRDTKSIKYLWYSSPALPVFAAFSVSVEYLLYSSDTSVWLA